jgi:DNA polymerase/3'-5' exonuclease PolX
VRLIHAVKAWQHRCKVGTHRMVGPSNIVIASALRRIAALLEHDGAEPTTASAYRHAAELVDGSPRPAAELIEDDGVEGLHQLGIGYLISGMITDWIRTGARPPLLERLERKHDPELRLQRVPGIGKKLAHEVVELGIESPAALARAARSGLLRQVCGFGPRRVALIAATHASESTDAPVQLDLIAAG